MAPQMRAVLFDEAAPDISTTRVGETPIPAAGPGQVVIRVRYAGINFKDVMARRGDPGYVRAWPFIPGLEVVGAIDAIADDVQGLEVGQPVVALTGEAGLAEFARADAKLTVPLPIGTNPAHAAALSGAPLTAALLIGDLGHLRPGESLLVHSAAGAVGHAVAQYAGLAKASSLIGTVGHARRVEAGHRNGYLPVVERGPDLVPSVRSVAPGGVDLILDPQGTTTLDQDLELAAPGARIILFGNASGAPLGPLPTVVQLMGSNVSVRGFSLAALSAKAPTRLASTLARVLDQLVSGLISVDVTVLDGLDAAADAHQALAEGRGETKYIVRVG